jgi:hypothetical protein
LYMHRLVIAGPFLEMKIGIHDPCRYADDSCAPRQIVE